MSRPHRQTEGPMHFFVWEDKELPVLVMQGDFDSEKRNLRNPGFHWDQSPNHNCLFDLSWVHKRKHSTGDAAADTQEGGVDSEQPVL